MIDSQILQSLISFRSHLKDNWCINNNRLFQFLNGFKHSWYNRNWNLFGIY